MNDSVWTVIKREWWFRVSRKLDRDYVCCAIARRLPKHVAYWAFVRVFANAEPYDHQDAYRDVGGRWLAQYKRD